MFRHRWQMGLGVFVVVAALASGAATLAAQESPQEFSSASREVGRAAVEYRDGDIRVVAAYYYSQRTHDSRWLLIETAVSTEELATIHRRDILLRTPQGREIPLATQRRVGEDVKRIEQLLQNARVVSHNVAGYFPQRGYAESMRLFTLPFGPVVHDDFVVDRHRVVVGPLFFESPTGAWDDGTYALVIRHPDGAAELPIRLE